MTEHQLPAPVAREDTYLAAILDELKLQHEKVADLGATVTAILRILVQRVGPAVLEPGVVELREGADVGAAEEAPEPTEEKTLLQRITGR